eukprot:354100-Chlamydomonas_euryale.AAC.3
MVFVAPRWFARALSGGHQGCLQHHQRLLEVVLENPGVWLHGSRERPGTHGKLAAAAPGPLDVSTVTSAAQKTKQA